MLLVDGVGRRFPSGTEALRGVSLSVGAGDFVALLGPSGCGKSTLLRLIAGLDAPSNGSITWAARPQPGEIGFVFQDPVLLPWATAAENVALPLDLTHRVADGAVAQALARVGLSEFADAYPRQLSGGMRMRVSIARALVTNPRVLLLDEPFAALDEFTRNGLQEDLLGVWSSLGCTVLFVTHSIWEACFVARRLVLMTPRPGAVAAVLENTLPAAAATRLDPAYALFVADVTRAMQTALGSAGRGEGRWGEGRS
jgi:NitT/TauT family transport system ATP-binding protein